MYGLHKITGRAKKCGPSALSAVLGLPTHELASVMREVTEKRAINGLHAYEMEMTLNHLDVDNEIEVYKGEKKPPTIAQWLSAADVGRYVVCNKKHWIAVAVFDGSKRDGEWADSGAWSGGRTPKPLTSVPLRVRLTHAIKVL